MPIEERKEPRKLLGAVIASFNSDPIVPRPLPSETMFMLMWVHLRAEINEHCERKRGQRGV